MRIPPRAGALALAGLSTVAIAAPAEAARLREAPSLSPVAEIRESLVEIGVPLPSGRVLARQVRRLAAAADRAGTPRFPVAGPFNWGQDGARYGAARSGHVHEGQDVFARTGTPLVVVSDGVVVEAGTDGGRGNYVAIYDPDARRTYVYLHMVAPSLVGAGERVRAGARVGAVGCSGSCFGDHLHLEARRGRGSTGPSIDPLPHLQRWAAEHGADATLPPGQS